MFTEKSHSKSSPKFGKTSSPPSSVMGSHGKGMTKMEFKERLQDRAKTTVAKSVSKPQAKENTRPLDFKLHTGERAVKRAMFNYSVATKFYIMELKKKQAERLQKMTEEEEIRLLRKEMVPKAQLMPFFDRPFLPQRSTRPLTMPREPSFGNLNSTCWSCVYNNSHLYRFQQAHA